MKFLSNAESWDYTQNNFVLVLYCAGAIAVVVVMVGAVVVLGKRFGHRHAAELTTAAMFWGLISTGSIVYATIQQMAWDKQNTLNLLSGYGDPNAVAPALPWILWGVLGMGYVGIVMPLVWGRSQERR